MNNVIKPETLQKENKCMKVALVSFTFGEYCVKLANALAQEIEVCLMLPYQTGKHQLSKLDQAVNFQPFHKPRLRQPLQQIQMIYTIQRRIKEFNPDVIHLQYGHMWFNLGLPLLRRYPLALTIHDPRHHVGDKVSQKTPQIIMDWGYHRADQLIVHSKQIKSIVVNELSISDQIIHVIPHIALGDDVENNQDQGEDHLILFFGRIWEYKGLEYLIRAEPLITAQVPQARIVIAGQGEDFNRYRNMMVNPEKFIVHNEYVSDDKRAHLFRQASIVVLPYIEASQSGVIPVAYTFAKPVIATTVGGLPEMVDDGQTGYLVPPRDERALANAVVCLLQDQTLRRRMGANGKLKIETRCSPGKVAQQTLAIYHRTVSNINLEGRGSN